jgi:uncharacterized protein YidB (DUF937 family)
MGLLDILNGMMHGPRGQRQPGSGGSGSGGMSPIMIALLGLLAYKALKGRGGQGPNPGATDRPVAPGGTVSAGTPGGGLGDILGGLLGGKPAGAPGAKPGASLSELIPGGLGSLFGGAAAGTVLSGALDNLIKGFQDSGHGRVAQSWVGTGPNEEIAPRGPGECTRERYDQRAEQADRLERGRPARRLESGSAGLDRSAHTEWSAADRARSIADGVRRFHTGRCRGIAPSPAHMSSAPADEGTQCADDQSALRRVEATYLQFRRHQSRCCRPDFYGEFLVRVERPAAVLVKWQVRC